MNAHERTAEHPRSAQVDAQHQGNADPRRRSNLDGTGRAELATGVPFLDHMLDQVARHGMIDLESRRRATCTSTRHHTVEDIGITLGQAVAKAVGDKKGIRRYGHAYVPLDEALSRVVIDFSGRPGPRMHVPFTRAHDRRRSTSTWRTSSSRASSTTRW